MHRELADCSKRAHQAAEAERAEEVAECEARIDALAAELWGLLKAELKDIQDWLKDLKE
jgi:hypothetical protein